MRRILAATRVIGVVPALRAAPRWLIRPTYGVHVTDLGGPLPPVPAGLDVQLAPLRDADVGEALAIDPRLSREAIRRRLAAGEECVLVWHEGEATHCVWWTDHPVFLPYLRSTFWPLAGDRFCVDVASRPIRRRRGIDTAAAITYLYRLRELGYRRVVSLVASWNAPARAVALRMHGSVVGTVGYWNLGFTRRHVVSGRVCLDSGRRVYVDPP